jgi:hypothetical protein
MKWLIVTIGLAGCGAAPGADYMLPLASLGGVVESSADAPSGNLRLALLWQPGPGCVDASGCYSNDFNLATEDMPITPQFPARFQMTLTRLPPERAMHPLALPQALYGRYAVATLVAYADDNDNGRFDLIPEGSSSGADRLLGVAEDLLVVYIEAGSAPDPNRTIYSVNSPGFNLLNIATVPSPEQCVAAPCNYPTDDSGLPIRAPQAIPLNTEIAISLNLSQFARQWQCESSFDSWQPYFSAEPDCNAAPPPAGSGIICLTPTWYAVAGVDDTEPLCGQQHIKYCTTRRDPGQPVPAGWPCPIH